MIEYNVIIAHKHQGVFNYARDILISKKLLGFIFIFEIYA